MEHINKATLTMQALGDELIVSIQSNYYLKHKLKQTSIIVYQISLKSNCINYNFLLHVLISNALGFSILTTLIDLNAFL